MCQRSILDAFEPALRVRRREVPEFRAFSGRPRLRIRIAVPVGLPLVPDDGAAGVGVPNLPVAHIGAREEQVDARVARGVQRASLPRSPVLAVSGDDHQPALKQRTRLSVDIDIGRVRDVVTLTLEEARKWYLPVEHRLAPGPGVLIGAIERRPDAVRRIRVAVRHRAGASAVEAGPAPAVVGLPGVDRGDDENRRPRPGRRLADYER